MARHRAHPPIIAAGPIAEDRRKTAHCPGARVPDVIRRVDVAKQHVPWWDLHQPLPEGAAAHQLHLIMVVIGRIKDPIRRAVGDEHVETVWDLIPEAVDRAAILHVGPIPISRCER